MTKAASDLKKVWAAAVKAAATRRGLPHGAGWVAHVDELYIVSANAALTGKPDADGTLRGSWTMAAKPVNLDPLLWQTLDSDSDMGGAAKQLGLRVTGAFSLDAIRVGFCIPVISTDNAVEEAEAAIGMLVETAGRFRQEVHDLQAFAAFLDAKRAEKPQLPYLYRATRTFTAVALGDVSTVRRMIDEALANQERTFTVGNDTLWDLLDRDLRAGTGVFAR